MELAIPYQLHGLKGDGGTLETVTLATLKGEERDIPADHLLAFFGLSMELGPIADWGLGLDRHHIAVAPATCATNIDGVFAIGDIATYPGKLKLILQGFSEAAMAAHAIHPRVFPGRRCISNTRRPRACRWARAGFVSASPDRMSSSDRDLL